MRKDFFRKYQRHLLKVANNRLSSWLLGLDRLPKELKGHKYTRITPNSISFELDDGNTRTAFYTHDRFAEEWAKCFDLMAYLKTDALLRPSFSPAGVLGLILGATCPKVGMALFAATTDKYTPSSDDGIYVTDAVWATAHGATTGTISTTNPFCFARYFSAGGNYGVARYFTTIDTSALPDTDTIHAASYYITAQSKGGADTRSYRLYDSSHSDTVTAGDFDLAGTTEQSGTYFSQTTLTADSATFNEFVLNATGIASISKTGKTKFCIREALKDVANTAPTVDENNFANFINVSSGSAAQDPYLGVTHGATSIKTVNGLAKASVKSKNGLAIASVKSINGLT